MLLIDHVSHILKWLSCGVGPFLSRVIPTNFKYSKYKGLQIVFHWKWGQLFKSRKLNKLNFKWGGPFIHGLSRHTVHMRVLLQSLYMVVQYFQWFVRVKHKHMFILSLFERKARPHTTITSAIREIGGICIRICRPDVYSSNGSFLGRKKRFNEHSFMFDSHKSHKSLFWAKENS